MTAGRSFHPLATPLDSKSVKDDGLLFGSMTVFWERSTLPHACVECQMWERRRASDMAYKMLGMDVGCKGVFKEVRLRGFKQKIYQMAGAGIKSS